ncbi:MAG: hypothetical protein WCJ26_11715 [bacterium]
MLRLIYSILPFLCLSGIAIGQNLVLKEQGIFEPQNKKVLLFKDSVRHGLILSKTTLQVNMDGTPVSYHPDDLQGKVKAINTIGNAVAIYKNLSDMNLFLDRLVPTAGRVTHVWIYYA